MLRYAKIIDADLGKCSIGTGTDEKFYQSIGMMLMDVEEGYDGNWYLVGRAPEPVYTVTDYDRVMEEHIKQTRVARGYTLREPSDYKDSSVPRWRSDAVDFIQFRDEVMLYGLEVQNRHAAGLSVPTLEEFKENLPICTWTYND